MTPQAFTEEDEKKYIEALNYVAIHATFPSGKVEESIKLFKHFSHLQAVASKINAHILEVKAVHQPKPKKKKAKK